VRLLSIDPVEKSDPQVPICYRIMDSRRGCCYIISSVMGSSTVLTSV
jgi:hypothetical protein